MATASIEQKPKVLRDMASAQRGQHGSGPEGVSLSYTGKVQASPDFTTSSKKQQEQVTAHEEQFISHVQNQASSSMPSSPVKLTSRGEVLQIKSPAEFFAENQNIAGFDNPGKSLYTTIRELVENSLDAAESIGELPTIELTIEEMTKDAFDQVRGVDGHERIDMDLYADVASKKKKSSKKSAKGDDPEEDGKPKKSGRGDASFFKVTCTDNGSGMQHDKLPNMLGRVLSGSKYGVRQTRGKFGLGAKMALIWSKKSTGLPIHVESGYSRDPSKAPKFVTECSLDIDIHKNEPSIKKHEKRANPKGFRGTTISLYIGGNWTTYRSRIVAYLRQLAIITPYAQFDLGYRHGQEPRKNFTIAYGRRSNQMPTPPTEVKHHPSSVNNLLMQQLLHQCPTKTLLSFLKTEFSCISGALAKRLITEAGGGFAEAMKCKDLKSKQIHQLVQFFHQVTKFPPPTGDCLSPAGEYNLRLGILKEIQPSLVATTRSSAAVNEGHPFIVEAGVCIGGKDSKEGVAVHRFANRIPLLFEAGADVATKTAKEVDWSRYKIDHRKDKVGVFVSIVSTKVPFKGTGKEYIGDDITDIKKVVKESIQACARQLSTKIQKNRRVHDEANRKKQLIKYIPDVSRALFGVLEGMQQRKRERGGGQYEDEDEDDENSGGAGAGTKRARTGGSSSSSSSMAGGSITSMSASSSSQRQAGTKAKAEVLAQLEDESLTQQSIEQSLNEAADKREEAVMKEAGCSGGGSGGSIGGGGGPAVPMFIVARTGREAYRPTITHESCVIKILTACFSSAPPSGK